MQTDWFPEAVQTEDPSMVTGSWAGYDVWDNRYADTEGWIGWLDISSSPFVYSLSLNGWMYLPENSVDAMGSWIYLFR